MPPAHQFRETGMKGTAVILTRAAWGSPVFPKKDLQSQLHPFAPFPLQLRETKPRGKPGHALVPQEWATSRYMRSDQNAASCLPVWSEPLRRGGQSPLPHHGHRPPPRQRRGVAGPEVATWTKPRARHPTATSPAGGRSSRALPGTPQWARLPPNLPPTPPPGSPTSPEPLLPQLTAGPGGQGPGSLPRSPEGVCAGEGEALPGLSRFP